MALFVLVEEMSSPTRRHIQDRNNPLETLSDKECVQRYRMNRDGIMDICQLLDEDLRRPTKRANALPTILQVCSALRFFSQGAFYRVTGDTLDVSTATMSRCVHAVARALADRVKNFVKFPNSQEELATTKLEFYSLKQFPSVIGAIDCTHVEIQTPRREIEADYVNRKSRHTINVQAVANARLEFTDIVARYPGRTHDAFIWANSALRRNLGQQSGIGWLLGDAGYPLESCLMTPFPTPQNAARSRYNASHSKTRCVIERAFGVLKSRYRCLDQTAGKLLFSPERSCYVIIACVLLHNMATRHNFYGEDISELTDTNADPDPPSAMSPTNIGRDVRANILVNYFN